MVSMAFLQCILDGSITEETPLVSSVHIDREVGKRSEVRIVKFIHVILQFAPFQFTGERFAAPCVVGGIVLHEDVDEADANGNITRSHSVDFGMALILEVVVHPLEFLFLQGYEEGKIPVLVTNQQSLIGMYGASFLHDWYVLLLNDLFAKILKELGRRYYTR